MQTDSHFMIGVTHDGDGMPCQDYARSLVVDGAAFAIVSDGCSTGGETDNGSRIVANAAARALRQHWQVVRNPFAEGTVERISLEQRIVMGSSREMQDLVQADLYATSLYAYYTTAGGVIHILGDGVVAWEDANGVLTMVRFDWLKPDVSRPPAPFYPAYYADGYKDFTAYYNDDRVTPYLIAETWVWKPGDPVAVKTDTTSYTVPQGINGPVLILPPHLRKIVVFTDGVTQVQNIEWHDAVRQLVAFKNTNGAFATRRMRRFYNDAKKLGRGALDDLSYAVILNDDPAPQTEEEA
ncbi:MAG TPA: protein phosphatase 2C domain-containing protein [Candidatus Saccharimonadales bacterium]|nr:protein phosphatase 2C domain-containing protein [Candidatus Saccharimonadales bacterium]